MAEDRLNPKPVKDGWSQFEEWAGMKWTGKKPLLPPNDNAEDTKGLHDERAERFNDSD